MKRKVRKSKKVVQPELDYRIKLTDTELASYMSKLETSERRLKQLKDEMNALEHSVKLNRRVFMATFIS